MTSPSKAHPKSGLSTITGGAGFVGTNLAKALLDRGERVLIFDNLSRAGVTGNIEWLLDRYGERVEFRLGDVRDRKSLSEAVRRSSTVFHLAAQVAVTTSVSEPVLDFEVNAGGTLNLLEALRAAETPPFLVFTSTNKVYGGLDELELRPTATRYVPTNGVRENGIPTSHPLELLSPYGCSKGAADQYVLDYTRVFGLPATVFRMSCIYGPHQFGTEDQGWVAHFLLRVLQGAPLTIYGDGKQVRDLLFADDLVKAMMAARDHKERVSGHAFNIGGGPANSVSLLELLSLVNEVCGVEPKLSFEGWRAGDQKYYVSDIRDFETATGWRPAVPVREGVRKLAEWLVDHRLQTPAGTADRTAIQAERRTS